MRLSGGENTRDGGGDILVSDRGDDSKTLRGRTRDGGDERGVGVRVVSSKQGSQANGPLSGWINLLEVVELPDLQAVRVEEKEVDCRVVRGKGGGDHIGRRGGVGRRRRMEVHFENRGILLQEGV
jgi:hypothetical protein